MTRWAPVAIGASAAAVLCVRAIMADGWAAEALPPAVDAAFDEAEAAKDLRVSYTMTFRWGASPPVSARFDAGEGAWSPISGDKGSLPPEARRKFETWARVESKPGGLTYADYRPHVSEVSLAEETPAASAFRFASPQAPKSAGRDDETVRTRLIIDKADGRMSRYLVEAMKPFRPNPVSRLDVFVFDQTFERALAGAPPLMTRSYWRAVGARGLSRIDEEYEVSFSDFAAVPPAR